MSLIEDSRIDLTVYVAAGNVEKVRECVARSDASSVSFAEMFFQVRDDEGNYVMRSEEEWLLAISFGCPLKASIFLATISANPERAAMFKLFWGGSQ